MVFVGGGEEGERSNKLFKKYEEVIQIMTSLFFYVHQTKKHHEINSKRKIQWHL